MKGDSLERDPLRMKVFHLCVALKLHVYWLETGSGLSETVNFQLNKPIFVVLLELETLRVTHH